MVGDSVQDTVALNLGELVPATVLETAAALFGIELKSGLLDLNFPELSVLQMVVLPTQRLEVSSSQLVIVDRLACLV
jgi:hypothetical protein